MALDFNMPVLVVDDYRTMVRIIRNFLNQLGFADVDGASDGSAALKMMHEKDYGLVISDWNMEPMTGYELLREVRADDHLSRTPFIVVTAGAKSDNVTVLAVEWESAEDTDAVPQVSTKDLGDEVFASTIQASLADTADDLDEAEIERSIREINEAIQRSSQKRK